MHALDPTFDVVRSSFASVAFGRATVRVRGEVIAVGVDSARHCPRAGRRIDRRDRSASVPCHLHAHRLASATAPGAVEVPLVTHDPFATAMLAACVRHTALFHTGQPTDPWPAVTSGPSGFDPRAGRSGDPIERIVHRPSRVHQSMSTRTSDDDTNAIDVSTDNRHRLRRAAEWTV